MYEEDRDRSNLLITLKHPDPGPDETPRGYYVHVCLDDVHNYGYSTEEHLFQFETVNGIIVRD